MGELFDASIVDHNPIPGVPSGRERNKSLRWMFHAAFDIAINSTSCSPTATTWSTVGRPA